MKPGERNLITDVAGLKLGHAEDRAARTGVTVVLPDRPARAAVDVRGGGPGTRETDALALDTLVETVDAVVLAGGSVYGLGAADGLTALLGASGRGFALVETPGVPPSPIVPAAVIYDLSNGGRKDWGEDLPYRRLGMKAFEAAGLAPELGAVGAGTGATAGAYGGGFGSASVVTEEGITLGAAAVVNSFGSPYAPGTKSFWAAPFEMNKEFGGRPAPAEGSAQGWPPDTKLGAGPRQNTTIAVIATDAPLGCADLKRIAIMAHDGLGRALRPAHGPTDGDTIFALSTGGAELLRDPLSITRLGHLAADTLARAIARGVF
ncbi:MAG: P1 family peptidase, partial [Parvularcula sp.]|nr:P1 family peptidase [Parvularcula sp.]